MIKRLFSVVYNIYLRNFQLLLRLRQWNDPDCDFSREVAINKRVVVIRKFISPPPPILVQRRCSGQDVDYFLHASFEVTWLLVQQTHFIQVHVVVRGLDVYVLGYFRRGGAWATMFEKSGPERSFSFTNV